MKWMNRFVAFDTETTGLGKTARIIEIAFVRFEDGVVAEDWSTFLHPDNVDWSDKDVLKALEVNKIKVEDLENQPSFMDVFHHIAAHLRGADVWVAHNAEFDLRMLQQEHQAHRGTPFPILPKLCLDTKLLSNKIHPAEKSHTLANTAVRWGVKPDGAHRASADAIVCGQILQAMFKGNALPEEQSGIEEFHKEAAVSWNNRPKGRW